MTKNVTKNDQTAKKPAASNAPDDIFAPVAPVAPAEAANTPAELFKANADGAPSDIDAAFAAATSAPAGGINFDKLGADLAERKRIEADARQHSGEIGNAPVDINTGEMVTTGFFMDLSKDDDLTLVDKGTRAVVVCTAAEAVVSSGGNPMLNLRVKIERVVAAPDPSKAPFFRNRTIKDRLMFLPPNPETGSRGTIWRARLAFKAFDIEFDARAFRTQAEFMDWLQAKAELFIGSVAEIVVDIDDGTSGGTKRAQIDPQTGEAYPPKNTIGQYFKYNAPAASATSGKDDLPF